MLEKAITKQYTQPTTTVWALANLRDSVMPLGVFLQADLGQQKYIS